MNTFLTPDGPCRLEPGTSVYNWYVRQFEGEGAGCPIIWDERDPDSAAKAERSIGYNGMTVLVRTRNIAAAYSPNEAFERMWASLTFELLGLQDRREVLELYRRVGEDKMKRDDFVRELARHEYETLLEREKFWAEVWKPWADSVKFNSDRTLWFKRENDTFEEWLQHQADGQQGAGTMIAVLGTIYDWLVQEAESNR